MKSSASKRVVVVFGDQQGTGVLLSSRYLLTCAHVVGKKRVTVAHPASRGLVPCETLWIGDPKVTDAALLRADHDVLPPSELGRLRWARLTRDDPLPGCQTLGFSAHQRYDADQLDFGQYLGSVLPVAGRMHGALTFWLDQSPGAVRPNGGSPLAGLSGSPVFAGSVLLGIVSDVAATDGHQHLEAVPVEAIQLPLRRRFTDIEADPNRTILDLPALENLSGFHPQDAAFEERYANALKAQYRKTEIFGIDDLGISEASWDLDTAYLSLEATDLDYGPGFPQHFDAQAESRPQRVEDLLKGRRHTLLRGEAGAGKTTLVWWLASHAACGTLPAELDELNGLVPFVIPMRSLYAQGHGFPGPDDLARVAGLPVGHAPDGWAERVLESGRAFILVDGLDELPQADRHKARAWLTNLIKHHSNSRCLATVRPGAVESRWLTSEGFADVLLLPMSDQDIGSFVAAWHRAARLEYAGLADSARAAAEERHLEDLEQALTREFARNRVLRDLARTPLLCAVICALHRKREGELPHTRWELYRATLDMLLGKRDKLRGIDRPEGLSLGVDEHKLLVQHIAVWLVRGGQTQLSHGQAITQIEKATKGMPQVGKQGTPKQILTHLLNRSGLLQERSQGVIQFIHRTFQDYLAAKEFADTDSVSELLQRAADEQWQDVIRLSVGHFDRGRVSGLIDGLGKLGDTAPGPETRRALHLLAGYCAGSAVFLDDRIRADSERRVKALMPPLERPRHVQELASLGTYVLPLLPGPSKGSPHVDAAIVETIAMVGDVAGMDRLQEFTGHSSAAVRSALVDAWTTFPAEKYAREVLSGVRLDDFMLRITTADQLRHLHLCGPASSIIVEGDHSTADLDAHLPRTGIKHLSVILNAAVTDLSFVRHRPSIDWFALHDSPAVSTLEELSDCSFRQLTLDTDRLSLPGPYPEVQTLRLFGPTLIPYADLARWNVIEHLIVTTGERISSLVDSIRPMPRLSRLSIEQIGIFDIEATAAAPRITELTLRDVDRYLNTAALARVFPSLRRLELNLGRVREYEIDMTPLSNLPDLDVRVRHHPSVELRLAGEELLDGRLHMGS
ncbi:NACHT domain-containing protein [Streptomyces sp. NPDC020681]|uniref:NACHT domain-containing protein n=1 Tax=Streptomyces sp. NPDC020681 TaxID=3365083 RepID=UPI0037BC404D